MHLVGKDVRVEVDRSDAGQDWARRQKRIGRLAIGRAMARRKRCGVIWYGVKMVSIVRRLDTRSGRGLRLVRRRRLKHSETVLGGGSVLLLRSDLVQDVFVARISALLCLCFGS